MVTALIDRVLRLDVFRESPPVCVDIGASGELPSDWRLLAPYSVCVAFDADDRDFTVTDSTTSGWRRLLKLNRLVSDKTSDGVEFYLTSSPHCSSTLRPNGGALAPWAFSELFRVDRTARLPAVALADALRESGITGIDWFKTDSQGTDLRILAALQEQTIDNIAVADFEPGIIDAYEGEDKLHAVMAFMGTRPFFVSDMDVRGSQRISASALRSLSASQARHVDAILKTSPGWVEISYLNTYSSTQRSRRDLLLGWVCATIKEQDGHAMAVAEAGRSLFGDSLFDECRSVSLERFASRTPRLVWKMARRRLAKLLLRRG